MTASMGNATVGGESAAACSMYTGLPIAQRDKTKDSKKNPEFFKGR